MAFGTAAENLEELILLLSDGREVTFSEGGCDDPEIEQRLRELAEANATLIDAELGRFPCHVSGYGLHYLLDKHGFDTAKALAGSEGTTGIITKLKVKLVPVPKVKALAVLAFDIVQITGDEVRSTRGRARMFSEMFRGESIKDGFDSKEVEEVLDLCLSCKACVSECPVNVDMATYKAEFLHNHYKGKLRPGTHYVMGWLPLLGYIAHKTPLLPTLIDKTMSTKGLDKLIAKVGSLDPNRPLIRFAHTSLRKWHKQHTPVAALDGVAHNDTAHNGTANNNDKATVPPLADNERTVVLWPDSFNSSLGTSPATAAVEVLEALGYTVVIPQQFVCCGLTWHSTGQLDMVKRVLRQTAKVMKPYLDRGLPVIGVEPSCTVMLQHEAAELCDDPTYGAVIKNLARNTHSFSESIAKRLEQFIAAGVIAPGDVSALTQVHCHEKSLGDPQHSAAVLRALGIKEEQITTGCCGLAGNWGFEKGHAEVSMALGERELFPKVRKTATEGKVVIADGFSCRTQIEQGTGTNAQHIAEIVRGILDEATYYN